MRAQASNARLQLVPGPRNSVIMLAETRYKQNRAADAFPLYQKAIALEVAAGRKPEENWYKRAVAVAYEAKSPLDLRPRSRLGQGLSVSQELARRDRRFTRICPGSSESTLLDLFRLHA